MSKQKSYTYLVGWTTQNLWYYGVRYANKTTPDNDLWKRYFTSSSYVKVARSIYGEPDIVEIRRTFNTKESSILWESKVLKRMKVKTSVIWLNKTDVYPNYDRRNYAYYNNGEIERRIPPGLPIPEGFTRGRLPNRTPDPGFGCTTVKDKDGNIFRISKDDPRYISGEVVMVNRGRVHDSETRKTFASKIQHHCPHCDKWFNSGNFAKHNKRYHSTTK